MELVLPMYNAYPYFSLKNLGKNVHYAWQNTGSRYIWRKMKLKGLTCRKSYAVL